MRRVQSRLNDSGVSVLLVSALLLMLVLGVCVMLPHHLTPAYGLRVRPQPSNFSLGTYSRDRDCMHLISVSAGDEPSVYGDSTLVQGGMKGLQTLLTEWAGEDPEQVTILLVVDPAASVGMVQAVSEMVLSLKMQLCYASVPAV